MKNKLGLATAVPAAILIFVLVLTLALTLTGVSASADGALTAAEATSSLSFGQMSDIHYFPEEHCYPSDSADYTDSDFYHSTTGDTKLVIESGAILKAHAEAFIADADAGIAPHYLFATGDLSKNGERVALIDVANTLRYLQNAVRAIDGYEDFQIFVVQGNHDLYNGSGKLYLASDGSEYQAEVVTSAQFALIFAGLGYPDVDYDTLLGVYPAEYWSSDFTDGYVASTTSAAVNIEYYSDHLSNIAANGFNYDDYTALFGGDYINALSYYVEIGDDFGFFVLDGTDREITEDIVPVRVSESEYAKVRSALDSLSGIYNDANGLNGDDAVNFATFYLENADGSISSTPATEAQINAAFASGKAVYANTGWNHITGGRLTEDLL